MGMAGVATKWKKIYETITLKVNSIFVGHDNQMALTKNFSFTSYEQPIRISNFCNKFLFTYFVSKYWQDKSFKLRPKYIKKCQYNSLHTQKKQHFATP